MNTNLDQTPIEFATELWMSKGQGTYLIVEGVTDLKFWDKMQKNFLQKNIIYTAQKADTDGNKDYVVEVMRVLESLHCNHVFGIVDIDFDSILGTVAQIQNLFYYRYHDLEITLLMTDAICVLNKTISSSKKKLSDEVLLSYIFECTRPVGLLRLLTRKQYWGHSFQSIQPNRLLECGSSKKTENDFITYFCSSNKLKKQSQDELKTLYSQEKALNHESAYLCNGHDAMKLLSEMTKRMIATDSPVKYKPEIITDLLIVIPDSPQPTGANLKLHPQDCAEYLYSLTPI